MAEIEIKPVWADPENWEEQLLEFCDEVDYKTKAGKIIKAWCFLGQREYLTFKERISNLRELVQKLGKNTDQWKGKRFIVTAKNKYFHFAFKPDVS